ncbi:MAG: winged helix-turn-helix domain-containing protein [Candidatus Saccharimonadales bacterium]
MIDALFGSKTRVKLLYLFLNNPGQKYYVREITRKIGEQINSVRRELSNMINVGIITSDSADNKLYYQANQRYEHYLSLRAIFGNNSDEAIVGQMKPSEEKYFSNYKKMLNEMNSVRIAIFAGVLVKGSTAPVDVMLVGDIPTAKVKAFIKGIESDEGREINYSLLQYDEFYYRLSVRDKFITEILKAKHNVIVDKDKVLNEDVKEI